MLFGSRKAQFKTRTYQFFWSEDGLRVGPEKWNDGNTTNEEGCRGPDGETSNTYVRSKIT